MNQREESRIEWTGSTNVQSINSGSLQRIADACELIGKNYADLVRDRNLYECWYKQANERANRMERRVRALRGVITRMRRCK